MEQSLRILGIDPGLNRTGFGVVDFCGNSLSLVAAGCIHVPAGVLSARLGFIYERLAEVIEETDPGAAAAELVFLNVNPRTTLLLGQARGAALACASVHGLTVTEFSPTEIKQSVVGTGRATKEQVQAMMMRILGLDEKPQADAADALACAVTFAHSERMRRIGGSGMQVPHAPLRGTGNRRRAWTRLAAARQQGGRDDFEN